MTNALPDSGGQDSQFRSFQYLGQGWERFRENPLPSVGFTVVAVIIAVILAAIDKDRTVGIGSLISFLISGPLYAGYYLVGLQQRRGQTVVFADFFRGFNRFTDFFLVNLLIGVMVLIGTVLCVLPGIYLGVSYLLAIPMVADRGLSPWEAMEASRQRITRQWFPALGLILLIGLVNLVGLLPCGLGLLVTVPWSYATILAAYEDQFGLAADAAG